MDHTRKMVLLPEDNYKYLTSQSLQLDLLRTTQTRGTNLSRKDDEMHEVLESSLSADEKWKRYEQLLNRYLFFKNSLKRKLDSDSDTVTKEDSHGIPITKIIATLPKNSKKTGENLLDFITSADGKHKITWDEKGVVKVDKKEIHGSNIIDLVNDITRKRKTFTAVGRNTFVNILNELGVPREFIGNTDLVKALNKSATSSNRSLDKRTLGDKSVTSINRVLDDTTLSDKSSPSGNQALDNRMSGDDSTLENFQSFLNAEESSKISTPKSLKKSQKGSGWLSLDI